LEPEQQHHQKQPAECIMHVAFEDHIASFVAAVYSKDDYRALPPQLTPRKSSTSSNASRGRDVVFYPSSSSVVSYFDAAPQKKSIKTPSNTVGKTPAFDKQPQVVRTRSSGQW
jgi:hypothetical protein